MGQVKVKPITKTERKAAIVRITNFLKEFKEKPEHAIQLDSWLHKASSNDILTCNIKEGLLHCGTVGCVGGYASCSPLMKAYRAGLKGRYAKSNALYSFFGLTDDECEKRDLFATKLWEYGKSDKKEGITRLQSLIKAQKHALEA